MALLPLDVAVPAEVADAKAAWASAAAGQVVIQGCNGDVAGQGPR